MLIYKILRTSEWDELQAQGSTQGAPIDLADGYVHFSTATQVAQTVEKHFSNVQGLWLLALNANDLGDDLKWEPSRGGALFPHLYAPLRLHDVVWAQMLEIINEKHVFPEDME